MGKEDHVLELSIEYANACKRLDEIKKRLREIIQSKSGSVKIAGRALAKVVEIEGDLSNQKPSKESAESALKRAELLLSKVQSDIDNPTAETTIIDATDKVM